MMSKELGISLPRHPVSARATIQTLSPNSYDAPIELQKALRVCRSAVILVVQENLSLFWVSQAQEAMAWPATSIAQHSFDPSYS